MKRPIHRTFSRRVLVASIAGAATILAVPTPASATPSFPGVVADKLQLATAPDCTLCHVGTPALGTVNTPFGALIRSRGAKAYDEDSIRTALDAIAAENKDSDKDGATDIAELQAGTDPNAAPGGEEPVQPEYGCTAAPGARGTFMSWLGLVLAIGAIGRRFAYKEGASWRK